MTSVTNASPGPDSGPWPGGSYALRPVVVVNDLRDLHGPRTGQYTLPLHLNASAPRLFDFGLGTDRLAAYQLVLLEAASPHDLTAWLDADDLLALWPDLYLPRPLRQAWESAHPVLAAKGAAAHVSQP